MIKLSYFASAVQHNRSQGLPRLLQGHPHSWSTGILCRFKTSLVRMHKVGVRKKTRMPKAKVLEGNAALRGVVLKVMVKKPKKPNSANRKCVRVRLTNGAEAIAYIPGEGHNLQEHSIVLCEGSKLQDCPGVRLRCVRGKYDLAQVKKKAAV